MKYSDYRPTGFDQRGLALDDRQDWIVVPVGLNRDSGVLEESNWQTALEYLGDESDTLEIHRFGHWACGWYEIMLAHPSRAAEVDELEGALENYPILNESDYSERQWNAIMDAWDNMSLQDRIDFAVSNGYSCFAARTSNPFDCNNDCGDAVYSLIDE